MAIPQWEIDEVKAKIDLRNLVAQDIGRPYGSSKNPALFKSPFREDRSPSFAVYADGHCFDYGDPGKAMDHIAYIQKRQNCTFPEAFDQLRKMVGLPEYSGENQRQENTKDRPRKKIHPKQVDLYNKNLPMVTDYLEQRAISYTAADADQIGGEIYRRERTTITDHKTLEFECRRVVIPYMAGNQVLSIEYRRDELSVQEYLTAHPGVIDIVRIDLSEIQKCDPSEISEDEVLSVMFGPRYWRPKDISPHVFGLNSVVKQLENGKYMARCLPWCILSEGAFDAESARALGFRASLGFKAQSNVDIRTVLRGVRLKFIMQDNDQDKQRPDGTWFNPGKEHAARLYSQLSGGQFDPSIQIVRIPDGYKDLNDLAKAGVLKDFLASPHLRIYPQEIEF